MKYLALEKEMQNVSDSLFTHEILHREAERVWNLYQSGIFREMYFRTDTHEAVLVLECSNLQEAQEAIASLPLVESKLIAFEIAPLIPYDGFARLFSS